MRLTKTQKQRFLDVIESETNPDITTERGDPVCKIHYNNMLRLRLKKGMFSGLDVAIETEDEELRNRFSKLQGWNGFLVSRAFIKKYGHLVLVKEKKKKDKDLLEEVMSQGL